MASYPRRPSGPAPAPAPSSYGTPTSLARNPLHLKVNRILSANFEDSGTRAALDTLGQFEHEADATTEPWGRNGRFRKGKLRKEVQGRMAKGSSEFLHAFDQLNQKLSLLQSHLDAMHASCDQVDHQLHTANDGTRYLLEHAHGLREQRATTTVRQSLLHLFLTRFTLDENEVRALTSREIPVGPLLFAAMDKTERIRDDCRALLSGEAGEGTQAGLDIMEYTAQHLDAGYTKIFKWCSFESRGFSKDALEVSGTMRAAISRLKARPDLLDEILALLGKTRSSSILNLFLEALTRGGPTGLPRPIELHAHDPIRYVGDMLAWIHQTLAGEREFLESFFGMKDDGRWVGSIRRFKAVGSSAVGGGGTKEEIEREEDEGRLRKLLDSDLEGCGRPLKIRVQQTIKSQEGSIMAYRIASLIHFYKITMERTIGEEALMSSILTEIMEHAYDAFFETLKAQGRSLLRFIQPPAAALTPPQPLLEALSTLREIMTVYSSSLLDTTTPYTTSPSPLRESEFSLVLAEALDPALLMCEKMSEFRAVEWDKDIFRINCWEAVVGVLEGFNFAGERRGRLEGLEGEAVERLIAEQYANLAKESGLEPILTALETKDDSTPLSHLPTSTPQILSTQITKFSTFLTTIDTLTSPKLSLLPTKFANLIHHEALVRISAGYGILWNAVMDERNRFEGKNTLLRRTKEDVELLLAVVR